MVSPHSLGFGYKRDEFIGTTRGQKMLRLLNDRFRDAATEEWVIVSEGEVDTETLQDVGERADIREAAIGHQVTTLGELAFWDAIRKMPFKVVEVD
jgi:hypothetical protein